MLISWILIELSCSIVDYLISPYKISALFRGDFKLELFYSAVPDFTPLATCGERTYFCSYENFSSKLLLD